MLGQRGHVQGPKQTSPIPPNLVSLVAKGTIGGGGGVYAGRQLLYIERVDECNEEAWF